MPIKFIFLLELARNNLDLCFLFYRFPDEELTKFIKVNKRVSTIEKLVQIAADRLDDLRVDWKAEQENPWVAQLQKLDPDVWKALADDSKMWIDFKQSNKPKKAEYIDSWFLQTAAYSLAHNVVYNSNITTCVILVCTVDNLFQEFKIQGSELITYQNLFLGRLKKFHEMNNLVQ